MSEKQDIFRQNTIEYENGPITRFVYIKTVSFNFLSL